MKRRSFITLLGGAAAAWPLAARAQQPERMRHIAILMLTADDADGQARITALREGLEKLGWTEGRNLRVDTRWAAGDTDRMRTYVTELVQANPDAILANGSPAVAALRQETRSIPIVFAAVIDPLGQGFVSNLARPGSNITGFTNMSLPCLGKCWSCSRGWRPTSLALPRCSTQRRVSMSPLSAFVRGFFTIAWDRAGDGTGPRCVGDRRYHRQAWAQTGWRPDRSARGVHYHASQIDHRIDGAAPASRDLRLSLVRRGRRADVLRARSLRHIRARSVLY